MTPRVAIASSGLGYVRRGIETWAATLAEGLHKSGGNAILFGSGPLAETRSPYVRVSCLRRDGWTRRWLSWDKAYLWEQITFARNLRRHLNRSRFDVVHVADPNLAQQLVKHCKKSGLALIYKDGLRLGAPWCNHFEHVQVLAPAYELKHPDCRVIPHFVDTKQFAPARVTPDGFTIVAAGDFSPEGAKRLDWIIDEVARCASKPRLKIAGHAEGGAAEVLRARAVKLGDRIELLPNAPHQKMPEIFRGAHVFAHAATREPFGIVLIEAMSSGLAILGHDYEVTKWIIGPGGRAVDMTHEGALAQAIDELAADPAAREALGREARVRALAAFEKDAVLRKYHEWHRELAQL